MKLEIELQPWQTPNFVIQKMNPGKRQDGIIEAQKYHIREVPAETLSKMCDEFRANIFNRAGQADPNNR